MGKNVQISAELFEDICNCLLFDDMDNIDFVRAELRKKIKAMKRRNLYTASKDRQISAADREQARQEYLDEVGMHESFRH